MRKKLFLILLLGITFPICLNADNIELKKKTANNGQRTESPINPVVTADEDGEELNLQVSQYEGEIVVSVYDEGGVPVVYKTMEVNGQGESIIDVTNLEEGQYTIDIQLEGSEYSGNFEH